MSSFLPPSISGDSFVKWGKMRMIFHSSYDQILLNHHFTRWAINLPTLISMYILNSSIWAYYLILLLWGIGCVYLILKITELCDFEKSAGWLVAIFLASTSLWSRVSLDLIPGVPCAFYILFGLYYFYKCVLPSQTKRSFVTFGVICFIAYLSKEDNVFFVAGFLLVFIHHKICRKNIFLWLTTMFGLFLVETFCYRHLGFSLGRASVIMEHHFTQEMFKFPEVSFFQLFTRRLFYHPLWNTFLAIWFIGTLTLLSHKFEKKRVEIDLAFLLVCYFVIVCLAVRSIHPLRPIFQYHFRYVAVLVPFMSMSIVMRMYMLFPKIHKWVFSLLLILVPLNCFWMVISSFSSGSEFMRFIHAKNILQTAAKKNLNVDASGSIHSYKVIKGYVIYFSEDRYFLENYKQISAQKSATYLDLQGPYTSEVLKLGSDLSDAQIVPNSPN